MTVESDPARPCPTPTDARARSTLVDLYDLEKTIGTARAASRTLAAQAESLKKAVAQPAAALDKLATNLSQVERELNSQMNAASALSRAIDGYSGLPTTDQKRQVDWVFEDATRSVAALNTVIQTDAPAVYADLLKQGSWPARPEPIAAPVRKGLR